MRTTPLWILAALLPALACGGTTAGSGSGTTCDLARVVPPVLTVTSSVTGAPICDAVLIDNDAGGILSPCTEGCPGTCAYDVDDFGAGSPFSVTVSAPGFAPSVISGLTTGTCGCDEACGTPAPIPIKLNPASPCSTAAVGGACGTQGFLCESGSNPSLYCNRLLMCDGSKWTEDPSDVSCSGEPACPAYATAAAGGLCTPAHQTCAYPQGTCVCSDNPNGGHPVNGGPDWGCARITSGCPATRPSLGAPCVATDAGATSCDYGACSGGVAVSCQGGFWQVDPDEFNECPG